jgi:hypothetical protein
MADRLKLSAMINLYISPHEVQQARAQQVLGVLVQAQY